MRKKSNKLLTLERNRFSVFGDGNICNLCGSKYELTWDEIFKGSNRQTSMKYGFCNRLCLRCHRRINEDYEYINYWHKIAQKYYESNYGTREDFIREFGRNYLD